MAARSTARASARASNATRRTVRRATNVQGAGESGMAKLTELSGVNSAGDVLVTVALAGTLFFSVPIGEARERVALYLLITMIPFALLAPVIGPLLDKFRSGRRGALAVTFLIRAILVWIMAGGVAEAHLWLYPAVFGVLVTTKAYGLVKAAGVPRLLPPNVPLVRANSWTNMAGLVAAALAAAVGAPLTHLAGPEWTLRLAAVVFGIGAFLSFRLPARIDATTAERPAALGENPVTGGKGRYVGSSVEMGLRANVAFRGLSGFLTLYLAFLLRENPIGSMDDSLQLSLVIGAAGIGSVLGTAVGSTLKTRGPEVVIVALLVVDTVAMLAAALWFSLGVVLAAGLCVGFCQTLGKLSLDSMIQRDVEEHMRSSAFARSETRLQLSWVIGGAIGIALPLSGSLGFSVAAAGIIALTLEMLRHTRRSKLAPQAPATPGPAEPSPVPPTANAPADDHR